MQQTIQQTLKLTLMRLRRSASEVFGPVATQAGPGLGPDAGQGAAPHLSPPWMSRVLDLARQGMSREQILNVIYQESLEDGGWMVDIGVWRNRLDWEVRQTLRELYRDGLLISRETPD